MPGCTLFPDTMKLYDDYTIREALHNYISTSRLYDAATYQFYRESQLSVKSQRWYFHSRML